MAYLHNNEYYTGYFAEGSSDYAGQQGPGYTHMTVNPTTNSAKTVNIYFAEPVICNSASGSFYKASAPSYKKTINVQYRLNSTKAWTSTRPSELIDGMILTNSQISGYSQGLSGFVWTFESKFTWGGEPDPEPDPDPPVVYPDLTPQVDNYSYVASSGLYLRRRAVSFAKPINYSIVSYISWPNNRESSTSNAYKIFSSGFNWANHKVVIVADLSGTSLISGFQNLSFCAVPTSPNVRIDIYRGGAINYGFFGTNVDFSLNSSAPIKDPLNDKYYTVWSSGGIWMYYSAGTLENPFLYGGEYLKRTGSPNITTNGPFYMYRNSFAVKFYGMEIYTNPGNVLVKRLLPCEYNGLDCLVDIDNKKIYLPDGSDPLNI